MPKGIYERSQTRRNQEIHNFTVIEHGMNIKYSKKWFIEYMSNEPCEKERKRIVFLSGRDYTRELIRMRDKHTCQICGKKWKEGMRRFDVHHVDCDKEKSKKYENFEKEKYNMVTLCHKCHLNLPQHRKSISKERLENIHILPTATLTTKYAILKR